jgi:hypothetical protein
MADNLWPAFEPASAPLLCEEDDPELWAVVVNTVYSDAQALCRLVTGRGRVVTRLGRCSHWLRPHQTRWPAEGGFAWPTGYDGPRFSRSGLPEFDWCAQWEWQPDGGGWTPVASEPGAGQLVFRVAVPARSCRHSQAAVHSVWQPGPPPRPRVPLVQFYGFRRRSGWSCTAYRASPSDRVYELAAEMSQHEQDAAADLGGVDASPC